MWLTARQALEWGFVDEITNDPEDEAPVITDAVADALAKEGIPMPPVNVKKGTFLEHLMQLFTPSQKPAAEATEPTAAQPQQPMKTFARLAALLGAAVALADGKITLTEAQADTLETALTGHDSTVADLNAKLKEKDATIDALNTKIADLKNEPAEDTKPAKPRASAATPENIDIDKMCDAFLKNLK